jgi:hypothetical protein
MKKEGRFYIREWVQDGLPEVNGDKQDSKERK